MANGLRYESGRDMPPGMQALMAEKIVELNSMISPFSGFSFGDTISSPVGMMPKRGFFMYFASSTPPARNAPQREGVIFVIEGAIISPMQISSPT